MNNIIRKLKEIDSLMQQQKMQNDVFYYVTKSLSNISLDKETDLDKKIIAMFATDNETKEILILKNKYPFLTDMCKQFIDVNYDIEKFREILKNNAEQFERTYKEHYVK
jgi:hypothetical protein